MKNGAPWSVKGIEPEARETAKAEARKMGKTLGQWLNQVIIENGQGKEERGAPPRSRNNVHARLEELARELAQISETQQPESPSEDSTPEDREDRIARALEELSNRFELSERQTAELLSEFRDDLNLLAQQRAPQPAENPFAPHAAQAPQPPMEQPMQPPAQHFAAAAPQQPAPQQAAPQQAMPTEVGAANQDMKNLEQALALIVDHIELTDKRNGEVLKSLHSRLSDVNARLGQPGPAAPAAEADPNLQKIAELEERIAQLAAKTSQPAPASVPQANLKVLQDNVANLAKSLNKMRSDQQPAKAISSLTNRYEELAGRLYEAEQQIPDQKQVTAIENRLKELAGRLEQSLETSNPHPQIADLESRISELAVQLESAEDKKRWDELLPQLDDKFGQIDSRLAETEARFKTLDSFESRFEQLFKGLEETRATMSETARMAAEQVLNQVSGQMTERTTQAALEQANQQARQIADQAIARYAESNRAAVQEAAEMAASQAVSKMGNSGADETLRAAFGTLEQGLDDVRANTDSVEKRTQETLKTVHDSLEKVMERLGSLEGRIPAAAAADDMNSLYEPGQPADDGAVPDLRLPPISNPAHMPETQPEPAQMNEGLDQIYGAGSATGAYTPQDRPVPPYEPSPLGRGGMNRNEDFIAAARRAAQTAAEMPAFGDESANPAAEGANNPKTSKLGSLLATSRKPLLYSVAAIALLGVLYVAASSFMGGSDAPDVTVSESLLETPPAGEQPADMAEKSGPAATPAPQDMAPAPDGSTAQPAPAQPAPAAPETADSPPAATPMQAPDNTNSIPPAKPVMASARPASIALLPSGGSSSVSKSSASLVETGNLPASLGSQELRAAAVAGNPDAQYEVATAYANGQGVSKDMDEALKWYRKAAARGLPMAQYRLGTLYEKGRGVKKDRAAARIWYSRAAVKGNRKAMHNLAVLNAEGGDDGTKPDFTKAAQWFHKAAELGLTDSQFNLAILSERGLGVPQSQVEAYKWFALARQNGDKDAASRLDTIANQMDSKTLVKARMAVKQWTAKPVNLAANRVSVPAGGWANASIPAGNATEALVSSAQEMLDKLGYNPGPADGLMGEKTRQAVRKFQSNEGLAADGRITPQLIARLKAAAS